MKNLWQLKNQQWVHKNTKVIIYYIIYIYIIYSLLNFGLEMIFCTLYILHLLYIKFRFKSHKRERGRREGERKFNRYMCCLYIYLLKLLVIFAFNIFIINKLISVDVLKC